MNKVLLVEKWTKKKGSEPWLIEDIAELIVDASNIGEEIGERYERERIIELIEDFQTQFGTGWDTVYSEGFASGIGECLALIKGDN